MSDSLRASKDTPKSRRTRTRILDAAMRLFAEVGYHLAGNAAIAEAAGLTRGAMLYHFPTREALVEGAVEHIQAARLALFDAAADEPPPGGDTTAHAIDAYWRLLGEPPFVAYAELQSVARTDPMVAERIAAAEAAFDQLNVGDSFLALAQAGQGARLQASRDLARFLLEGLSRASLSYAREERIANLLTVVDRAVRMLNRKGAVQELWPE
ncbi:MAG TPA: TetR/AcrR family transcriptional regulator [Caulobacteraceae bacterium]|nr:TetR/AcrR family transcriptional regulator [Caulobacteraceae bacterium]